MSLFVKELSVRFAQKVGNIEALRNVSLEIASGEFISVVGPSGCGKTTLLRAIGGLIEPTEGSVEVFGTSAAGARKRRQMGFVFQNPVLFDWRTVVENISLPLEIIFSSSKDSSARTQMSDYIRRLIHLVGLSGFEHAMPRQLSGGMRSRVAIARALSFQPPVLLMDEPFGALDEQTRLHMNLELQRIWSATGSTVIFVTHSLTEAVFLSDRVVVLTSRPGMLEDIIQIRNLDRPRMMEVQDTPPFALNLRRLRQAMKTESSVRYEVLTQR